MLLALICVGTTKLDLIICIHITWCVDCRTIQFSIAAAHQKRVRC